MTEAASPRGRIPLARVMAMAMHTLISDLHVRLARAGYPEARPAFGFVLLYIRDHEASVQDVASMMGVTKQAASKLVASMEEAGLVRRELNQGDRRAWRVVLDTRGEQLLGVVEDAYAAIEAEWAAVIGQPALEQVRSRLLQAVRAQHEGELPAVRPTW